MRKNKKIAYLGIGIALYVVLSTMVIIPIVNRIKLDLGYIIFGYYLKVFGYSSTIVAVAGCIISNLLKGGSFPIAWAIAQAFIAICLSYIFSKTKKTWIEIIASIIIMYIGIGLIKTFLEVLLFQLPLEAKLLSNFVAFIADTIPLIIGIFLSRKIKIH